MVSRRLGRSVYVFIVSVMFFVWIVKLIPESPRVNENVSMLFEEDPDNSLSPVVASATLKDSSDPLPSFINQFDPQMIEYIRANHLLPPSRRRYNISRKIIRHLTGTIDSFSSLIMDLARTKRGIFVEAGAYNGVDSSTTLSLELLGWKGLLVECNPQILPNLLSKNRKAWISNVCLSPTSTSSKVKFFSAPEWPASAQIDRQLDMEEMKAHGIDWIQNKTWVEYERPSFPLYSIITATGFTRIDFLSLDVQGAEIGILKNYPFEKIPVKVIIAEIHTFPETQREDLKDFLTSKGYRFIGDWGIDYVFALTKYLVE